MPSSSPSNLSGDGDNIGAVGEAGDVDMSSPPNLSADRGGVICNGIWPGSYNVSLFPISSLSILQGTGLPTSSLLIGQMLN